MTTTLDSEASASSEFHAFLDRDWKQWLEQAPEVATAVGAPGLNDRWTDDSAAGVAARRVHLAESLAKLDRFDREALTAAERLNHDLLRELLVSTEEGLQFGNDPFPFRLGSPHNLRMPVNQMEGVQLSAADIGDIQPLVTVRDFQDLLARLDAFPIVVENNLALLDAGRRLGFGPPKITLVGIPGQITSQITPDPMSSPVLKPFREFPGTVPTAERPRLTSQAVQVYRDRVVPALSKLREYLHTVYLPTARETIGASALPNGPALYSFLVRWQTTTGLTPQQVHEIGLAEVRRIRAEMDQLIRTDRVCGELRGVQRVHSYRPPVLLQHPGRAPRWVSRHREESRPRTLASVWPPAAAPLRRPPRTGLPRPHRAGSVRYMPGAPTTGRPGYFYANTYKVGVRPRWEMEALTLHEAVPGHHLQISLAQEPEELPEFRRQTGFTAFVEGWGLYAESLGEELGLYRDPYSKFGQLTYDMWRSIRLVVDTGMHALGWSREHAMKFFRENSGKSDQDIQVEVDRYIVWPAQALAYKIGQLKIRELRTLAERKLGDRFDVRAFHDVVLEQGALPLNILTERVDRWIQSRTAA